MNKGKVIGLYVGIICCMAIFSYATFNHGVKWGRAEVGVDLCEPYTVAYHNMEGKYICYDKESSSIAMPIFSLSPVATEKDYGFTFNESGITW